MLLLSLVLSLLVGFVVSEYVISHDQVLEDAFTYDTKCLSNDPEKHKCLPQTCARHVIDGLFTEGDVNKLMKIVQKGMGTRESRGGPTILDINTGFIRDSAGLANLFSSSASEGIFDEGDFAHYGKIILKLKSTVMEKMNAQDLFFTAPTFITRLDGREDWEPDQIHDEYWHVHADRNNTAHYHYSGLLYLSEYGKDFTGGEIKFYDPSTFNEDTHTASTVEQTIQPRPGRVLIFSSGPENPHRVERVESGQRFVLAFWFTCMKEKEFEIFLDGKAHMTFSAKVAAQVAQQQQRQQQQKMSEL